MRIGQEEDGLEILIRDDGVGFDLVAVSESGGHYGLVGLRERARLAGGNLQVISAPGAGTTLSIRLPLESAGAE
jgi:signal transduction histidine kinase